MPGNPYTYYSYDLKTGNLIGTLPLRDVTFGQTLNAAGQMNATINITDPNVQKTNPIAQTVPNRTFIVVDFNGSLVWGGMPMTRKWSVDASGQNTTRSLDVQCSELFAYFGQRVQATDYSAPPTSGIAPSGMDLWKKIPFDVSLIGCQIFKDAIGFSDNAVSPYGNPLGGLGLMLNGKTPNGSEPASTEGKWVAITYPFVSLQTVETIINQLTQLGYTVGFDFGIDIAYSAGPASKPVGTINVSYPRRGRKVSENSFLVDVSQARRYEVPEDGTQTANQVYEVGGSSAIEVIANIVPLEQGYPVWERVISRSTAQSQNIISLLKETGTSDAALYSYAPVAASVTLPIDYGPMPLGSFMVGDDFKLVIPELDNAGKVFDQRFPAGLEQPWRITQWMAKVPDEGDATMQLTVSQPPQTLTEAIAPAV